MQTPVTVLALLLVTSLKSYVQSQTDYCDSGENPPICPMSPEREELNCGLLSHCCPDETLRSVLDINVLVEGVTETAVCTNGAGTGVVWSLQTITERSNIASMILPTSETEGSRFQSDGNNLEIRNITGNYEGIYKCRNGDSGDFTPVRCLLALGRAIFMTCPDGEYNNDGGCDQTEVITLEFESMVMLDVRVAFELGGPCRNQNVRTLSLVRSHDNAMLFSCSSLGNQMPLCCEDQNQPSDRVTVTYDPSCTRDCKYNIQLMMANFNSSDVGMYIATVTVDEGNPGDRRMFMKTFDLQMSSATAPPTTPTGMDTTTSSPSEPQPQSDRAAVIAISVILVIMVVPVVVVIGVVFFFYYRKRNSKQRDITEEQLDEHTLENNFINATVYVPNVVGMGPGSSTGPDRNSTFEPLQFDLSTTKEAEVKIV